MNQANPREYLTQVRRNTCYPTLRLFIGAIAIIIGIGWFVTGVAIIDTESSMADFLGIMTIFVGILFAIIFRQASFLLIDLVDATLYQHAKNQNLALESED